ncbi:hypothetical protein B0H65DRAFT_448670 [Neurospora tetraspora]|uniref:Uncharacterized protein n=1 Tax=Neurospora tetraspora TaxID=94610 RepID=A0AAE0JMZ9_9PEZI|nr:hypothetical protein B0H65DRAFT_448670 [Neurospora tetraspora]
MKPSNSKMPTSSSDETSSANTFNSFVDNTTSGIMTNISLTPRASLESTSAITPPSQQHSNHHHGPHSPPHSPPRSPPDHEHKPSSDDQQAHQEDQQKVQDQITEPGQDPEQQEQSQPQQQQPHKQHQPSPSTSEPSPTDPKPSTEANNNNKGKTALNEFITRSRSSTLYTPSDNERDEQIRIAILMRCLDMEERFQVQAAKYWGCLQ